MSRLTITPTSTYRCPIFGAGGLSARSLSSFGRAAPRDYMTDCASLRAMAQRPWTTKALGPSSGFRLSPFQVNWQR